MAIAAIRRENESSEKLISRWNKKCQSSRTVNQAKKRKYRDPKEIKKKTNDRVIKTSALVREKYSQERKRMSFYS